MGIRPTDLPVSFPQEGDLIRRVEPEAAARDLGQKEETAGGRGQRHPRRQAVEDQVEPSVELTPSVAPDEQSVDPPPPGPTPDSERHLDIIA